MKDGKDMKKIYTMSLVNDNYVIFNKDKEERLKISKKNLVLDGKELYENFFSDFTKDDVIDLILDETTINESVDKLGVSVYDNTKEIIDKIQKGIKELDAK